MYSLQLVTWSPNPSLNVGNELPEQRCGWTDGPGIRPFAHRKAQAQNYGCVRF